MGESRITFPSEEGELEGLYDGDGHAGAVVVTHPHPLYGGDMYSPVVEAIAAAYRRCGFSTLRFNFRGTGRSAGTHDGGRGERTDVRAAFDFLRMRDAAEIHLSGYSFGAWVNALAMQDDLEARAATMVAPPVAFIDFPAHMRLPMLGSIVAGSDDTFAPPDLIESQMHTWNPMVRLAVIHGADHFFFGFLDEVRRLLTDAIRSR